MISASDRIKINIERDRPPPGSVQSVDMMRRAGQSPFLDIEQSQPQSTPPAYATRTQTACYGQRDRQPGSVIDGTLSKIMTVDMRR